MVPVGLGIVVTSGIGRCGKDEMIGWMVCQPPLPVDPVPPEPDEPPAEPPPAEPVDPEPLVPVPAVPPTPPAPVEPAPADDCPVPGPSLPLVIAAVPAVTRIPVPPTVDAWCTGKMTATTTAAADTRLPAMAAVLARVLMSDLLLVRPRPPAAAAGEFVTPVGVLSRALANNFSREVSLRCPAIRPLVQTLHRGLKTSAAELGPGQPRPLPCWHLESAVSRRARRDGGARTLPTRTGWS